MMIEVFFETKDKGALHIFSQVVSAHQEWRKRILSFCEPFGFTSFRGPDFCTPDFFLEERFSHSPRSRGRGFNLVNDKSVYEKPDYALFTLRRDYPAGAEIHRQIDEICQSALASVNLDQNTYGRPFQAGYQHAICLLLDIDYVFNVGDISAFSQIWHIIGSDNAARLICSVPVLISPEDSLYRIPDMPPGWYALSSHEVIEQFNFHNIHLAKASKG